MKSIAAFFGTLSAALILAGLVLLTGCDPDQTCDYCRLERGSVWRNVCDECKGTHLSCSTERALFRSVEGRCFVMKCPPSAPAAAVAAPAPTPPSELKGHGMDPSELVDSLKKDKVILMVMAVAMAIWSYFVGKGHGAHAEELRRFEGKR